MRFLDFCLSVFLRNLYGFGGIGEGDAQATHQAWVPGGWSALAVDKRKD